MEECVHSYRSDCEAEGSVQSTGSTVEVEEGEWRDGPYNSERKDCEETLGGTSRAGLQCMYTNACSLLNKMNELRQLAASHTIDIIAVTETWATDELSDAELAINDFVLFRKDRKNSRFSKRRRCCYL